MKYDLLGSGVAILLYVISQETALFDAFPNQKHFIDAVLLGAALWLLFNAFREQLPAGLGRFVMPPPWRSARSNTPPRDLIPLKEAARKFLEAAPQSTLVQVARRMNEDPDELLNFLAIHMVNRDLPVWGKLPPSTVYEQIGYINMRAGHVTHGATTLTWGLNDKPGYVDLAVRRSDLKRLWNTFLTNIG